VPRFTNLQAQLNDGQDTRAIQQYLGHRTIQHTHTLHGLDANRFKDCWRD
jgi:site-specific recombinase XerD